MKKYVVFLLIGFSCLILPGCNNEKTPQPISTGGLVVDSSVEPMIILDTPIVYGDNISLGKFNIKFSGSNLMYDNLFSISIPNNLEMMRYGKNQRLDIFDKQSDKYIHVSYLEIPSRKENKSDREKCILGSYESHILSVETNEELRNGVLLYITKALRSAGNSKRNDLDLCFIKENIIYTISISAYDSVTAKNILDSFTFIE